MQLQPAAAKILLYILIFIIAFSIIQFFMLIHPIKIKTKVNPTDLELKYEDVTFETKDGLKLKGWFIPSDASNDTIIITHGYPADKNNLLGTSQFLLSEYNLFLFDFRYFGESEGLYTTGGYREIEDINAAVKYLKSREDVNDIGAMGFSLGAATLLMAHHPDIKAIVSDSSYASLELMLKRIYWIFPGFTKWPFVQINSMLGNIFFKAKIKDIGPLQEIKSNKAYIFFMHGRHDNQIPISHSQLLYENSDHSKTEFWTVENAGHGSTHALNQEEYEERVMKFFKEHI